MHTVWEGAVGDRHDLILGHECCAEVVETGALVKDFQPGDRVLVPAITPDWSSLEAQAGYAMHSGGMLAGWKFSNIKDGVFAEYFHVNDADGNLAHLPESMDILEACMLSDMVPTGFHGAELADVQFGDTVLVVGIGPVGLMSVAGAALRGAARILAVGTRPVCVEAARQYGASDFISYKDGPIDEQVLELTGGKGVTFATGTPVSNSMVELYTIMRYLQYDTLQKMGLSHFDDWAASFGETVTAIELSPEGTGYRAKTRFARFFNLPELISLFKESADVQTADMLNLPVPQAEYINEVLKPSETQEEMVSSFADRAEAVRNGNVNPRFDNMLKITNDGRKLALDQRLMNEMLPDEPESKVNRCVDNAFKVWEESAPDKGTQLIFCDLSTPKADGTFNVYDDVREKLVARGVPREEVAFIHEFNTETKKADLFAKVRALPWRALGLAACCFTAMFGSVLTLGREALSDYQQWSADDIALATYIDENAESDALFLTSDSHLTPVFALAGRQILCGSGSYVYYHGMDYSAEYNAMRALYETPDEDTLAAWDIGYAVFDSSVYAKFAADESWYAARYDVWYENAACRVYKIK